jgi:hypothetical protein
MTSSSAGGSRAAESLGWFSVALGLVEMAVPRAVARSAGIEASEGLIRAFGMRELVNGIGLLASPRPAPWLWARAGGDILDLAVLTASPGPSTTRRAAAVVAIGAITAVDVWCAASASSAVPRPSVSYLDRSGYGRDVEQMRGAALADFTASADMRIPEALRPLDALAAPKGGAGAMARPARTSMAPR